jgi:hypothetical protein
MLQQSPEDAKNCQLFQRPYAMSFMPQAKVFISLNHLGIFFASNEKRGIFLIKVHVTTNVFFASFYLAITYSLLAAALTAVK